ncbi:hypothetical protein [Rhodophyticola porphyridii]|uniref:Tetratricopeptide repeat protein n=1 Tax=Rhodophyticola porphyridii TaxID=1852017 RepID=A0A3L9Y0W8_9RHOB|nr:hypothetical protein [Rhodophyticola porphyridii]RMA42484.1 hypothetical protein D9R08_10370 [Rhodophyticola porphyridii]
MALIAVPLSPERALAQTGIETCLAAPGPACVDLIAAALVELEKATVDPDRRAWAQLQLAGALAEGGQFDAAEQVLARMEDPPTSPGISDTAILNVITFLDAESLDRGLALLDQISDDGIHAIARAQHIAYLVEHGHLERAFADVVATDRSGLPLGFVGLDKLAVALIEADQIDTALRLVVENIPDDLSRRGALLRGLVVNRLDAGEITVAQDLMAHIVDPTWRIISNAQIGEALAQTGEMAAAEEAFALARSDLAALPNPDQRYYVFEAFARATLSAGRSDLAIAAISDVSTYRFDQVDAYDILAQMALSRGLDIDFNALLRVAMDTLEAGPSDGGDIGLRFDDHLGRLARTMAMSGDIDRAVDTLARIRDDERRTQDFSNVALSLVNTNQFEEALALLSTLEDLEAQARGLISLARAADLQGNADVSARARGIVLGLVEGPEWVPLSDYAISRLAELESSQGYYAIAENRLRFLEDTNLQRWGRIANLGFAALNGTPEEFQTYLAIAQEAVADLPDPADRQQLTSNLVIQLVYADRIDEALRIAHATEDAAARDAVFVTLASALSGNRNLTLAMAAADSVADPIQRQTYQRLVWISALRQSLGL